MVRRRRRLEEEIRRVDVGLYLYGGSLQAFRLGAGVNGRDDRRLVRKDV